MATIITKEWFTSAPNNEPFNGLVLVRNYVEKPTSNNTSTFISGTMEGLGVLQFKVWQNDDAFSKLKQNDLKGVVCSIKGNVNEYNGTKSLIVLDIEQYTGTDVTPLDFMEKKYDEEYLWNSMIQILRKNCSFEAVEVFQRIIEPIEKRFREEYAAINHHDSCVNGLLAHTCKTVKIAQVLMYYPTIRDSVTYDAIYLGCALHDIGKVLEYNNGSMSELGKTLNHLTLGLTLIMPHREFIVQKKGKEFYDTLMSVIQQHHGEYGERPKTLAAYLVHIFDMLESRLTDASDAIQDSVNDVIKLDDFYLHINK